MFCRSSFVVLAIVLSVLLRYTDSDYPFGIFKLFLIRSTWLQWLFKVRLMRNDMNCLLFRIVFQLLFRLNWNSCLCCACLCFYLVFFRYCFVFCFICFCLVGVALLDRFMLSFSLLFGFHTLFFSKQLATSSNSYMPFYHNIIGF